MSGKRLKEKELKYIEFLNREEDNRHHTHDEDSLQYELLKAGDPRAAEEHNRIIHSGLPGHVSDDPLRNAKYLFVATATLASRAAMSVGLDNERALNISDLYIQKMDHLSDVEEVHNLASDMMGFYAKEVAAISKKDVFSRPVEKCLDYIYMHLHEQIRITDLAELCGLNETYLSTLFKKEMGVSISKYAMSKRMEAARNMLKFSEYTYAEIASYLAFSSQSHFSRTFKKECGMTPREYRMNG